MTDYCELFVFSHTDTLSWALPKTRDNRQKPSVIRIQSHHGIESLLNLSSRRQIQGSTSSIMPWRLQHTLLVSLFRTTPHHDKSWQKKEDGRYVEYNAIGNKPTRGLVIYSLPLCRSRIIAHAALTHLSYPSFNTCYDTFLVP